MTEPLPVVFQRRATREIEEADEWWRANRPSSADLFVTELERMLGALAVMPEIGTPARSERASGIRRALLRRTQYGLYYRVRNDAIEVLAVWHTARGSGPGV